MRVDNIPDPILKDMLRTLEGDAPILYGNWTKHERTVEGQHVPACGCLMMDNHVQEYFSFLDRWAKTARDLEIAGRGESDEADEAGDNSEMDASRYLAMIYTKSLQRSSNYRGFKVTDTKIGYYANQFDHWAREVEFVDEHGDGYRTGTTYKVYAPHTPAYVGDATTRAVLLYDILTDEARKYLARRIKAQLNARRRDPSLHAIVRTELMSLTPDRVGS